MILPEGYTENNDRVYNSLGNSMAVPVMRWILSRIEAVSEVSHAA